jgi:hypothetical protein
MGRVSLYRATRSAFLDHERVKAELKALMPEDAKEATGHGVRAKRSKSGAVRAQAELTNPEKALVATIRVSNPREKDQTFRYAALSSGLDIVRKTLGGSRRRRSTATRGSSVSPRRSLTLPANGFHPNGRVCLASETATPRRMGAALTATPSSTWSPSPERTTSTHQTSIRTSKALQRSTSPRTLRHP